jgi:hypothetical protein
MQNGDNNPSLTIISGIFAVVSISSIQPLLTLAASLIAIVSGLVSIYKKTKRK